MKIGLALKRFLRKPALADYGYDGVRLEEGRRLWAEANAAYIKTLKVARVAFY